MPQGGTVVGAATCFCFVSRYPYFSMHFEMLRRLSLAAVYRGGGSSTLLLTEGGASGGAVNSSLTSASSPAGHYGSFFEEEGVSLLLSPSPQQSRQPAAVCFCTIGKDLNSGCLTVLSCMVGLAGCGSAAAGC